VRAILLDICAAICNLDPDNCHIYQERTNNFIAELDALHDTLYAMLKDIKDKPIFTAHNSFSYFIREFALEYGGVLEDIPGKEISPKYYAAFLGQVQYSKVKYIFSEPQLNYKLVD
jgi:ABC-type Zn uptake system ZnuABC Zn-binding protein ZnuA